MKDLLIMLLVNAIFCNGVFLSFSSGHIFSSIKDKFIDKLPAYINKPLWSCVMCMASVWGCVFLIVMSDYHSIKVSDLIVYLPALAFLNGVLHQLQQMMASINEVNGAKTWSIFNKK